MSGVQILGYRTLYYFFKAWHITVNAWPRLMRPVIISLALFLSIGIGLLIATGAVVDIFLLAALIAPSGLLILYKLGKYEYGIVLIIVSAGMIRFYIPATQWSIIVTSLMVSLGLVGVWLLQMLIHDQKIQLKPSPINKPLLTFMGVSILAYVWGNLFRDPLVITWGSFPIVQIAALVVNILLPGLVLLVSNKIQEVKWLRWLTVLMLIFGTIAAIGRIFFIDALIHDPYRNTLIAIHDGGIFSAWVGVLAYSNALFNEKIPLWQRGFCLALALAWVYYSFIMATSWVSGWLPLCLALAILTWLRSKWLFLLASIVGTIYLAINFNFYWETIVLAEEEEGSGTGRMELWERNLNHIVKHPFFGMGPAGYAVYNMSYHPEDARSTHNNYFDIAAQTGLIGLAVFIWLFVVFVRIGSKTRRWLAKRRDFEESFANACLAGCFSVIVSMMLGDWILPFAYNQGIAGFDNACYSWVFLGCMISLYHIVIARENADQAIGRALAPSPGPVSNFSISATTRV